MEDKNKKSLRVNKKGIESVKSTYDLYTSDDVEFEKENWDALKAKEASSKKKKAEKPVEVIETPEAVAEPFKPTKIQPTKEEVKSIKSLRPLLQKKIQELAANVDKARIDEILNVSKEKEDNIFAVAGKDSTLSAEDQKVLKETMRKWTPAEEIQQANAVVIASWADNIL